MRSAGLTYAADGTVAWDKIWGSFCNLAMAGGPPHKGALLEPGTRAAIDSDSDRYDQVVDEICRGITLATDLQAGPSPIPGWMRVVCYSDTMAGWLRRAITMENISVRCDGLALDLPAAPGFRLEKEIKNVITVVAKTSHYWLGHMPTSQKRSIAILFETSAGDSPLIAPEPGSDRAPWAERIHQQTGLSVTADRCSGWLGVGCPSVGAAVWMMRALVALNVLSRREETTLFVPVNPGSDPDGDAVVKAVSRVHRLAGVRNLL